MGFSAKILIDSVSPDQSRLTTFEVTFPRMILPEFNTHRLFSRNSASSRAIPVEKMLKRVEEDPFIPTYWGKNQKGMQAEQELDLESQEKAKTAWLAAKGRAVDWAKTMLELGVHKQITNRLLEPFMWHTVIVTATEWSNFFNLRDNKDAQPEIKTIAQMMKEVYYSSIPKYCEYGDWHLPLIDKEDLQLATYRDTSGRIDIENLKKVSVGRCARVSYLTHDGKRDHKADVELHDRLLSSGHMSPFEHIARPLHKSDVTENEYKEWVYGKEQTIFHKLTGNFKGWVQYRKTIPGEFDMLATK